MPKTYAHIEEVEEEVLKSEMKENLEKDAFWTYSDLSEHLKISIATLKQLVKHEEIPFVRIGRLVRFQPEQVYEWIRDHIIDPGL